MVAFADIEAARRRAGDGIRETPCRLSEWMSKRTGAEVYLKLENLQRTGSFKSRGALNRLLLLSDDEKKRGVIAASAGNHAQGVAYHATNLGIPSTIVMPVGTPLVKTTRTAEYGATVVLAGDNYDAALEHALALAGESGAVYIPGFDDDAIIAGQGTCGLELIEQNPYLEVVIVPVGGGGLISGIALALKKAKPTVRLIGVESSAMPSMQAAIEAGAPVRVPAKQTIAEGIAVGTVGTRCLEVCRRLVDEWVNVDDDDVARAILGLLEREKTVAEGAGAAAVGALLSGRISDIQGKNVVALVCGGNIDVNMLSRIIERGLAETGRIARLEVLIGDRPGALAAMLARVAETRANVVELRHERAFFAGTVADVQVELKVETRGHEHVQALLQNLKDAGFTPTLA
jgi:threonine dehydratase